MKRQNIFLIIIFGIFLYLHFQSLSQQEFIGDEASPMLLIDRMWDATKLRDIRYLGYPFLFYSDPFRSIFSGTLLNFFGPDKIILRLPSILMGLATFGLLVWILKKEKIAPWLINLAMLSYSVSPIVINDRSGGGDAQTRFLFLLSGYLIWQSMSFPTRNKLRLGLLTWSVGMLTMLDAIALLPGIITVFFKHRSFLDRKMFYLLGSIVLVFFVYFSAWMLLPYLAFLSGFQKEYIGRGLFYYFSRVGEGAARDPFTSIRGLINYTSLPFALWIILTALISFRIKNFFPLLLISIPAWIFVILLNRSSFHIIMFVAFFFLQAVLVTDYLARQYPWTRFLIAPLLISIIFANAANLFTNYFLSFKMPPKQIITLKNECLDEAVIRIYKAHDKKPPMKPCEQK